MLSASDCEAERAPRAAREAECEPVRISTTTEASAESRFGAGAANAASTYLLSTAQLKKPRVRLQSHTKKSMIGTSVSTPTTVASDAPEFNPNKVVETAMATSKWLLPAMIAVGAASS